MRQSKPQATFVEANERKKDFMKRRPQVEILAVGIFLALLCASINGLTAGEKSPSDAKVAVKLFQFQPAQLEVKPGTTVTWINEDDIGHTITSGNPENKDGRFDMRLAGKGTTFSFTFTQPGTYAYFCNRHQSMQGQIRVNR
jgi:plastocyanin